HEDEHAGKKDGDQAQRSARQPVRQRADDGAKIGREGEERTRNGLRGAIAGKESIIAHPAGRYKGLAQQRQHHVTAAKYQRARAVEGFEESYSLRYAEAAQDGKAGEQEKEGRQRHEPDGARDRHGNMSRRWWRRGPAEP